MRKIQLFYLEYCPHCRRTRGYLEELMKDSRYCDLKIEWIEESKNKELADQYDYYYVPCFYVDQMKVKEGVLSREDVQEVLEMAVN